MIALLVLAAGLTACGESDDRAENEVPDGAIAVVGDETISERQLDERVAALKRAQPKDSTLSRKQLRDQALTTLLQRTWIEQEAARRGIQVDRKAIRQRWEFITNKQFRSRAQLERFLQGRMQREVVDELWRQEIVNRIHDQIRERVGAKESAKAIAAFQRQLSDHWRQAATCSEPYARSVCDVE